MAKERVVLIDGTALIFRAFFKLPQSLATSGGIPTNATFGFALSFQKLLAGRRPTLGAVVFDAPGRTFRDERYPAYKAQRPPLAPELAAQLPWITRVVEAHDFPLLRVPGYEADDVIGTLTREALAAGHEVHIVSGDKDFAQLIGPDVRMVDTMRDVTYDAELVRKKWGVPPEQFIDFLALAGDEADNIPGVPGVGPKTAQKLLEQHGTLAGIYAALDGVKGKLREQLAAGRDAAFLSQELATIDQHAELPLGLHELVVPTPDRSRIDALYRELEFFSLVTTRDVPVEGAAAGADEGWCVSDTDVRELLARIGARPAAVVGVFEGPSELRGTLLGLALAPDATFARYVPLRGDGAVPEAAQRALLDYLTDAGREKWVHGLRDLWCLLERHGLSLRGVSFDTQLASFLVEPTANLPHELDQVARAYVHHTVASRKSLAGSGKQAQPIAGLPVADVSAFACHHVRTVAELVRALEPLVVEREQTAVLRDLTLPLSYVLGRMQLAGIRVDPESLATMGEEFERSKAEVERRIHELAGREFNVGSQKQLGEILFDQLGLPILKRTKTGYSTEAEVLEELAPRHPIVPEILRWRTLAKLINTYTEVLTQAVSPEDGRIHCVFQQTTSASGRLITTEPDLQRTPIRGEDGKRIREAFVPAPGWILVSADWSQIELRILAHVSADPLLIEAFATHQDVHRRTAAEIFDVAPESLTPAQRNVGKTVNFATIYGQGPKALGRQIGVSTAEAKRMITRYFARYAGVARWRDETVRAAYERGYVTTLAGRRRYIPELTSQNPTISSYGERIAGNTPIQGSAADLCELAMLQIEARLRARGLAARMLLQIHDELLFECPPEELDTVRELVRDGMEHALELRVPLVVDIGHGRSWAEAH